MFLNSVLQCSWPLTTKLSSGQPWVQVDVCLKHNINKKENQDGFEVSVTLTHVHHKSTFEETPLKINHIHINEWVKRQVNNPVAGEVRQL